MNLMHSQQNTILNANLMGEQEGENYRDAWES